MDSTSNLLDKSNEETSPSHLQNVADKTSKDNDEITIVVPQINCYKDENVSSDKKKKVQKQEDKNKTVFRDKNDDALVRQSSSPSFYQRSSFSDQGRRSFSARSDPRRASRTSHTRKSINEQEPITEVNEKFGNQNELTPDYLTSFEDCVIRKNKRPSIASIEGTPQLMRPPVMGIDEVLSKSVRERQWYMAIHSSHPSEVVPILKKPVLPVGEEGELSIRTVRKEFLKKLLTSKWPFLNFKIKLYYILRGKIHN